MYKLLGSNIGEDRHISLSLATKDESAFNKVANKQSFPDEVAKAIKNLKKKKDHSYMLLTAMGDETWGPNNNGDLFPTEALLGMQNTPVSWDSTKYKPEKDERMDMGREAKPRYKTFEDAHFFHHHKNKIDLDPHFGGVKGAYWHPKMRTVLLILEVDNKKDPESAEMIAANKALAFSMGCKVPFDVCSICGNKANNIFKYCQHLKFAKNQIMNDGKRVSAINLFPRFFDISKVTKPAFLAGMGLEKIAFVESNDSVDLADYYNIGQYDELPKEDQVWFEDHKIPEYMQETIEKVADSEPNVSMYEIKNVAKKGVENALGAFAYKGIVLKPNEFAAVIFEAAGRHDMAQKLLNSKAILSDNPKVDHTDPSTLKLAVPAIGHTAKKLSNHIDSLTVKERSIDTLGDRIYDTNKGGSIKIAFTPGRLAIGGILTGLYLVYRNTLAQHPGIVGAMGWGIGRSLSDPLVKTTKFIGNNGPLIDQLNKTASGFLSSGKGMILRGGLGFAAPYIAAAHIQRKESEGRNVGIAGKLVANNPGKLGVVGALGAMAPGATWKTMKSLLPKGKK